MKKNNQKKQANNPKLEFTGERFIPALNKGAAFFYEHLIRYLFVSQFTKDKIVLDAGSGAGYGSHILSKYGHAKKVFGVDISSEAVKYAKDKYGLKNISFKVDNIEKLDTIGDKEIQLITSFEVIEHIINHDQFLKQVKRVLKKDGLFFVSTPNKYNYPEGNEYHLKELYPEEFTSLLKRYFKNVKLFHQSFEISQVIKEKSNENFEFEENFELIKQTLYTSAADIKKSQYIVAICSDVDLPRADLLSINSNKVDGFDFSKGVLSLGEQFSSLTNRIAYLENNTEQPRELNELLTTYRDVGKEFSRLYNTKIKYEKRFNELTNSKFFIIWQLIVKLKKIFL